MNRLFMPEELLKELEKLKDGEIQYLRCNQKVLLSAWKDHKLVLSVSNFHCPKEVRKEMRARKAKDNTSNTDTKKEIIEVEVPEAIADYNKFMGGVDNFDQLHCYYIPELKSRRWYIKIFFHFLEISIINSYIIYKKIYIDANSKYLSHLEYRKEIIRDLIRETRDIKQIPSTEIKQKK